MMTAKTDPFTLVAALAALEPYLLAHTVVSGAIDADGTLTPVLGIESGEKLFAVVRDIEFPRVTHFAMADGQPGLANADDATHQWRDHLDGRTSPRFVVAKTFADLVRGLRADDYVRRGVKLEDYVGTLRRSNERYQPFVAGQREWLRNAVQEKMTACGPSGYVLVTMPAGWGKTAFTVDLIERGEVAGAKVIAWHFSRRGRASVANQGSYWDSVAMLSEQIETRLRLNLAIALPCCLAETGRSCIRDSPEAAQPLPDCKKQPRLDRRRRVDSVEHAKEVLRTVIHDAARCLKPNQKILICIDGLDETFGALGMHSGEGSILPGLLPERSELPDGIYVLLTSRPGQHLSHWLTDPSQVERIQLENGIDVATRRECQLDDIRRYLRAELDSAADRHGLERPDPKLVERVASACEFSFYVAVWYASHIQKPTGFGEVIDLDRQIPQGLDGVLRRDWQDVGKRWKGDSAVRKRSALRALLGILAVAREAPSIDVLREMHKTGSGRGFPSPCGAKRQDIEQAINDLHQVAGFFDADTARTDMALDWAHTGIADWIAPPPGECGAKALFLSREEISTCHAVWVHSCRRWSELKPTPTTAAAARLRRYALRWLPWHASKAGAIDEAEDVLRDYAGWMHAGYEQSRADIAFGIEWPAVVLESIDLALTARENEQPHVSLSPEEYFRYLASSG